MTTIERRRSARAPVGVEVEVYTPDGKMLITKGELINVSTVGVAVKSKQMMMINSRVALRFILWEKFQFMITGEIVRIVKEQDACVYGVRFNLVELTDRNRLKQFIQEKVV